MDISCAFPPVPDTPDHIALAERLGYRRAWVYRALIEATPKRERHLLTHRGHLTYPNDLDRKGLTDDTIRKYTMTGDASELRARIESYGERGVTEIAYQPAGPDVPRELTAFAEMAGVRP